MRAERSKHLALFLSSRSNSPPSFSRSLLFSLFLFLILIESLSAGLAHCLCDLPDHLSAEGRVGLHETITFTSIADAPGWFCSNIPTMLIWSALTARDAGQTREDAEHSQRRCVFWSIDSALDTADAGTDESHTSRPDCPGRQNPSPEMKTPQCL